MGSRDRRYALIGCAIPSTDSAGRRYPLVAAVILTAELFLSYRSAVPIACEVFLDGKLAQLENALDNSVEALSCRQYLEGSVPTTAGGDDLRLAESVVTRFLEQQSVTALGALLAEQEASPAEAGSTLLQQALLNILFYQDHLSRFDSAATNQLIGLPLSGNAGEQALVASAWLELVAAITTPAVWNGNHLCVRVQGDTPRLLVGIGQLPDAFCGALIGRLPQTECQLDLRHAQDAWKSHRMYAEVSYAVGRLLADPHVSIASLCVFLRDVGSKVKAGG